MAKLSAEEIQTTIANLANPRVNFRIDLASTPYVARQIIKSLPGVQDLSENGPEVADVLLTLLQDDRTLQDENFASISLHILSNYPSERVKLALAKPISERKFTGFSSQFAAEAFLQSAGVEASNENAITLALREARKLQVGAAIEKADTQPKMGKPSEENRLEEK